MMMKIWNLIELVVVECTYHYYQPFIMRLILSRAISPTNTLALIYQAMTLQAQKNHDTEVATYKSIWSHLAYLLKQPLEVFCEKNVAVINSEKFTGKHLLDTASTPRANYFCEF